MKLNKTQKDIVKNIAEGKITDILSFVEHYNLGEDVCFSKPAVINRFNEVYANKKFLCNTVHFDNFNSTDRIIERIDQKTAYCTPKLTFEGPYSHCSCNGISNSYHLFQPVYITKHIEDIVSFIALWQYLKTQALIIELPKSCTKKDMGLFLEPQKNNNYNHTCLDETRTIPYDYFNLDISFHEFFDGEYELNNESFEICFPYLTQKIYPAPELKIFIQKGYNTIEELNNRRNLAVAFAGVIIAIFTSLASILIPTKETEYYSELNKINHSLQEIENALSTNDINITCEKDYSSDFNEINDSLQQIRELIFETTNKMISK